MSVISYNKSGLFYTKVLSNFARLG